jgi:hypothetical protein
MTNAAAGEAGPCLTRPRQERHGGKTTLGAAGPQEASFAVRDPNVEVPLLEKGKEQTGPLQSDKPRTEAADAPEDVGPASQSEANQNTPGVQILRRCSSTYLG